jgi:hypothetical protein
MLLIFVLLILFFGLGGGYWGYTTYGPRGGFGIVGLLILLLLLFYFFGGGPYWRHW